MSFIHSWFEFNLTWCVSVAAFTMYDYGFVLFHRERTSDLYTNTSEYAETTPLLIIMDKLTTQLWFSMEVYFQLTEAA